MPRTYASMVETIGEQVCLGDSGCPWIAEARHSTTGFIDPFGTVHWSERRWTRRGARNFLLLVAKARRLRDPEFLNAPRLRWYHVWWDHREMDRMAAQCGFRIPARLSRRERGDVFWRADRDGQHLARDYPAVYAWAMGYFRMNR